MCGRFTRKYTWREIHELYRLTVPAAIPNFRPLYNVCPTDPADTIVPNDGQHELVEMRWGLIPYWWSEPLKELRPRRAMWLLPADRLRRTKRYLRDRIDLRMGNVVLMVRARGSSHVDPSESKKTVQR